MGPVATETDLGRNDSLIAENQALNSSTNFQDSILMAINNGENRRVETAYGKRRVSNNIWGNKEFNYQRMLLKSQGN